MSEGQAPVAVKLLNEFIEFIVDQASHFSGKNMALIYKLENR